MKNCVYRFINENNEIIYVGKAKDLKNRLNSHNHLPNECYVERKRIEYVTFDTEDEMDFAERYFILKENPKYNTVLSGKDFSLRSIDLDIKDWILYDNQVKKDRYLDDSMETFDSYFKKVISELKVLDIKKETLEELKMDFNVNKNRFTDIYNNLLDEIYNLELESCKKLKMMSSNKLYIVECIRYRVTDIQDVIDVELRKIEDKYYEECAESIKVNGYYKENIYEHIDMEFVHGENWMRFLDGQEVTYGLQRYAINVNLKNKLVDNIIANIQKRLEDKYGELKKEIVMLDSEMDYMKAFYPKYNYKKFNKPFIVYKMVN